MFGWKSAFVLVFALTILVGAGLVSSAQTTVPLGPLTAVHTVGVVLPSAVYLSQGEQFGSKVVVWSGIAAGVGLNKSYEGDGTGSWTTWTQGPGRSGHACVSRNSIPRVYCQGGADTAGTYFNTALYYQGGNMQPWVGYGTAPKKSGAGSCLINGSVEFFSFGVDEAGTYLSTIWTDPGTIASPYPGRSGTDCAQGSDGIVYFPGGLVSGQGTSQETLTYNPTGSVWAVGPALPKKAYGGQLVSMFNGNYLLLIGSSIKSSIFVFDVVNQTWSEHSYPMGRLYSLAAKTSETRILVVGGLDSGGSAVNTVDILTISEGAPPTATATASPTSTQVPPTASPTSTITPVPPTASPTSTLVSPTASPTSTQVPPTASPTSTQVPPTASPTSTTQPAPTATVITPGQCAPGVLCKKVYLSIIVKGG